MIHLPQENHHVERKERVILFVDEMDSVVFFQEQIHFGECFHGLGSVKVEGMNVGHVVKNGHDEELGVHGQGTVLVRQNVDGHLVQVQGGIQVRGRAFGNPAKVIHQGHVVEDDAAQDFAVEFRVVVNEEGTIKEPNGGLIGEAWSDIV